MSRCLFLGILRLPSVVCCKLQVSSCKLRNNIQNQVVNYVVNVQDVNLSRLYYMWGRDVKEKIVSSIEYIVRKKERKGWIPACAGMTEGGAGIT